MQLPEKINNLLLDMFVQEIARLNDNNVKFNKYSYIFILIALSVNYLRHVYLFILYFLLNCCLSVLKLLIPIYFVRNDPSFSNRNKQQ
jgi:hypothetical protein